MMTDLATLAPSIIVCVAFIVGVVIFLRRQMAAKGASDGVDRAVDPDSQADTGDHQL
jgi:hypothetical protein